MTSSDSDGHAPVLLAEIVTALSFPENTVYVDGTLGLGGHLLGVLGNCPSLTTVVGIDADEAHLVLAKERILQDEAALGKKLFFVHSWFGTMKEELDARGLLGKVTSILLDLGVCSLHLDKPERGFSFRAEGPLDMRFDKRNPLTASTIINTYSESSLSDIFFTLGEERFANKIANKIVLRRKEQPFETTEDLATFIGSIIYSKEKKHPATRVFQALRIAVNDELGQLEKVMNDLPDMLAVGGVAAIISYHSLEDRIVKNTFKTLSRLCVCPPELLRCTCGEKQKFELLTKKPTYPTEQEIAQNPRARSAKLRIARKLSSS